MTYAAQQWTVDALLPILSQIKAKKVLVPCGFSAFYDPNYSQYFFSMSKYIKQYDWLIFLSRQYRDIEFARKYKIKHFSVIPNGAGADEFLGAKAGKFRQKYNLKNKFIVLTVGSHTGDKGHIQCIEAFKMAKLKNAVLVIIGNTLWNSGCASSCKKLSQNYNRLSFLHQNKILVLDPPRQEIVQAFLDADLFVFASKIECSPLVLFEAMASKIPFLTTPVGNAAEIIKWSQGGLLIKSKTQDGYVFSSPEDFARQLKRLQSQPNLRNKLGYNGFRAWKSQFTWEKIVDQYEKIYYELIKE